MRFRTIIVSYVDPLNEFMNELKKYDFEPRGYNLTQGYIHEGWLTISAFKKLIDLLCNTSYKFTASQKFNDDIWITINES